MGKKKVLVIGLDGFTWKVADHIRMDNLERIRKLGSWGILKSTIPPNTIPAWISFATGCNPGKHGIFGFCKPKNDIASFDCLVSSRGIKVETLQQIIRRNGMRSVLINLHGSTPALTEDPTLGTFISRSEDIFSPRELAERFKDYPAGRGDIFDMRTRSKILEMAGDDLERRFDVARQLFDLKPDFFFLLISETDHVQHAMFNEIEGIERSPMKDEIIGFYRKVDDCLGWFLDAADEKTFLILMSDHGFRSYGYTFSANSYLAEKGLMHYRGSERQGGADAKDSRYVLDISDIVSALCRSSYGRKILDIGRKTYNRFQNLTKISDKMRLSCSKTRISADPVDSKASGSAHGFIHINSKRRFPKGLLDDGQTQALKAELLRMLKEERSPFTGEPALSLAKASDDLYWGPYVGEAPDIVIHSEDHMITGGSLSSAFARDARNFHDRDGIFALIGSGIRKGRIEDRDITDIAPTILHILGLAVPSHMDGKVIGNAFHSAGEVRISNEGPMRKLNDRLRRMRDTL